MVKQPFLLVKFHFLWDQICGISRQGLQCCLAWQDIDRYPKIPWCLPKYRSSTKKQVVVVLFSLMRCFFVSGKDVRRQVCGCTGFFFLGRIRVSPRWFESWVRQNDQILWFHWFSSSRARSNQILRWSSSSGATYSSPVGKTPRRGSGVGRLGQVSTNDQPSKVSHGVPDFSWGPMAQWGQHLGRSGAHSPRGLGEVAIAWGDLAEASWSRDGWNCWSRFFS